MDRVRQPALTRPRARIVACLDRSAGVCCRTCYGCWFSAHATERLAGLDEAYREKGRFTPQNRPAAHGEFTALTYPVLADGRLYIRELNSLWCYDVKAPK